ncbi:3-deoxy-D-manno-octulosonic acid transferase [Candidatus Omnitrophota bacterium]
MIIYDIFFLVFAIIYLPYLALKSKAHKDFIQRFGVLPRAIREAGTSGPIWIHAVSVGEVLAIKNLAKDLSAKFPKRKIVLSTTTKTGHDIAQKVIPGTIEKFYFPLDFSFTVKKALNVINPSLVVIAETEIWPNLILELKRRRVPVALVNGRLSERSFGGYKKIRFLFSKILESIDLFCMQAAPDAERIKALGAPAERVKITGNMKFDLAGIDLESSTYEMGPGRLLIAGSTHGGEEEIVLQAYRNLKKKFSDLRLLIAPRHIDRSGSIKKLSEEQGLDATLTSRSGNKKEKSPVLVLDTLGELGRLYSLATVVFMGGSLIKRGGHNLIEPAVFGKPIVFGPYMFNFRDMARLFLEDGAALKVEDEKELESVLEGLLADSEKRDTLGQKARGLIEKNKGATERNVTELERFVT